MRNGVFGSGGESLRSATNPKQESSHKFLCSPVTYDSRLTVDWILAKVPARVVNPVSFNSSGHPWRMSWRRTITIVFVWGPRSFSCGRMRLRFHGRRAATAGERHRNAPVPTRVVGTDGSGPPGD